jgi:hypothetical protein
LISEVAPHSADGRRVGASLLDTAFHMRAAPPDSSEGEFRGMCAMLCGIHLDADTSAIRGRPEVLADLARGTLRKKLPQLHQALVGNIQPHHLVLIGQILAHIDFLTRQSMTSNERSSSV